MSKNQIPDWIGLCELLNTFLQIDYRSPVISQLRVSYFRLRNALVWSPFLLLLSPFDRIIVFFIYAPIGGRICFVFIKRNASEHASGLLLFHQQMESSKNHIIQSIFFFLENVSGARSVFNPTNAVEHFRGLRSLQRLHRIDIFSTFDAFNAKLSLNVTAVGPKSRSHRGDTDQNDSQRREFDVCLCYVLRTIYELAVSAPTSHISLPVHFCRLYNNWQWK